MPWDGQPGPDKCPGTKAWCQVLGTVPSAESEGSQELTDPVTCPCARLPTGKRLPGLLLAAHYRPLLEFQQLYRNSTHFQDSQEVGRRGNLPEITKPTQAHPGSETPGPHSPAPLSLTRSVNKSGRKRPVINPNNNLTDGLYFPGAKLSPLHLTESSPGPPTSQDHHLQQRTTRAGGKRKLLSL